MADFTIAKPRPLPVWGCSGARTPGAARATLERSPLLDSDRSIQLFVGVLRAF